MRTDRSGWPVLRNIQPPITAMARPAIIRTGPLTGPHGGPLETSGGEIKGTAAVVCLAA
jgi:hypothetical protein